MKKLNGYRPVHKNRWLLIKHGVLTIQELSLFEFYIDISDFDIRHEKFGQFEERFKEFSTIFQRRTTTLRNWHNKLLKLRFIQKTDRVHIYTITNPKRYITSSSMWKGEAAKYAKQETDQTIEIILQSIGIDFQKTKEKVQSTEQKGGKLASNKPTIDLGSYKDESKYSLRSKEEYQRIHKEGKYEHITPSDIEWIDNDMIQRKRKQATFI
jgi:hypothetical protein